MGGDIVQIHLSLTSLCLLLAAAAASDAASRRVPNTIPVVVAALGLAVQFVDGGARAAFLAAGAALLVLAVLLVPFSRRMLGGGDVKLMVACTTWTGFHKLPVFLVATALAGGLVALVSAVWALRALAAAADVAAVPAIPGAPQGLRAGLRAVRVPYSIAITTGALIALHWSTL